METVFLETKLGCYRFFGQDIGGFAGPRPEKELFLRWIQYGVFTPRFTLHSWNDDGSATMPWLYEDLLDLVKKIFELRQRLVPYLFSEANRCIEEYRPLIQPLLMVYPDYDEESDFFLCGPFILACPVFDAGVTQRTISLPETDEGWYHEGKLYHGNVTLNAPLLGLPVYFVRAGSILPMEEDGLCFQVFAKEHGRIEYDYYDDESIRNSSRKIIVICTENDVYIYGLKENENAVMVDDRHRELHIVPNLGSI